jgi:hypothetical protein
MTEIIGIGLAIAILVIWGVILAELIVGIMPVHYHKRKSKEDDEDNESVIELD